MPTMTPCIQFYRDNGNGQCMTDYLNTGAAVACGKAISLNGMLGIVAQSEGLLIGSTTPYLGAVATCGVWRMRKTAYQGVIFSQFNEVYWHPTNELASPVPASGYVYAGIADEDAAHGHTDVKVRLNELNPGNVRGTLVTTTSTTTTPAPTTTTTT